MRGRVRVRVRVEVRVRGEKTRCQVSGHTAS